MVKAISLHSVVPVRAEASEKSEQTTQMLFGELCTVLDEKPRWNRIKLDSDGQEGWVDAKMICPMKSQEYVSYAKAFKTAAIVSMPMAYAMSEHSGQIAGLTAGTLVSYYAV